MKQEPEVSVSEEEMRQRFFSEYNSFESEYIVFDNKADAENFIEKVKKNPGLWKDTYDEKKANGQKGAAWINIMSLGALVDLWQIPEEDAYRILSHKAGDFIAANFYYGIAVFRLLYKKEANQKEFDEKRKKYYKETIAANKKRKLSKEYFDDVFKRAAYKDYAVEEKRAAREEAMKRKSLIALQTNKGEIDVRLFPDIAPKTCENFIALVEKGYYNNTIFHRVKKGFMIQGGDPTGTGAGGESIWKKPFEDEVRPDINFDRAGILAMANSGPDTNKSQFFITTAPATWLDQKHTIFGEVVSGYETVEKIENVPTDPSDRPKEEVKIIKAYIAQ
jgi:peptidylprolyl isomerase